jgi:hypothetical protein
MLRAGAPRFRIAREGGIRRAAAGYGSRLHLEKEQSAPRCSLPCDWGTAAWPAAWTVALLLSLLLICASSQRQPSGRVVRGRGGWWRSGARGRPALSRSSFRGGSGSAT